MPDEWIERANVGDNAQTPFASTTSPTMRPEIAVSGFRLRLEGHHEVEMVFGNDNFAM